MPHKQVWFGLVSLFNGICRLYNAKSILLEEQQWYYLTNSWEDKGVHTCPKGICKKGNVIARLEYELAYYDSAVNRFKHYTTRTPPHTHKQGMQPSLEINCISHYAMGTPFHFVGRQNSLTEGRIWNLKSRNVGVKIQTSPLQTHHMFYLCASKFKSRDITLQKAVGIVCHLKL